MAVEKSTIAHDVKLDRLLQRARVIPWRAEISSWRFTFIGDQAAEILGYPIEAWYAQDFWVDHIHPDDRDEAVRVCVESSLNLDEYEFSYRFRTHAGDYVWLLDLVKVEHVDGVPTYLSGFMIDISERKKAEKAEQILKSRLTQNRDDLSVLIERMSLAVNLSSLGIWEHDVENKSSVWDDRVFEMYGIEPKERVTFEEWARMVHPDDLAEAAQPLKDVADAKAEDLVEFRITRPTGELRYLNSAKRAILDDAGKVVRIVGFCMDVTEEKRISQDLDNAMLKLDALNKNLQHELLDRTEERENEKAERRYAEEALRETAARFRMLYEHAPVMIDAFDENGHCVMWNKHCEKVFGWTAEEIFSHADPLSLFYPDPEIRQQVVESVTAGPSEEFREWKSIRKDGSEALCLWANFRLPDGLVINIGHDITDQRRSLIELKISEQRLRKTFEYMPDALLLVGQNGTISYANPGFEDMFGYTPDEIVGKTVEHLVPEDLRELHVEMRGFYSNRVEAMPMATRPNLRGLRKDGTEIFVEITLGPLPTSGETLVCCVMRDVTDRLKAQREAMDSEARLRLLLESTAESIYGLDLQGRCTFANSACLEMLGYSRFEELLGQNMHDLIHHTRPDGTDYPENECRIFKAFRVDQGTHVDDEVLWRKDGSSFAAEYWSYPVREGSTLTGSVVTFIDITKRRRAEEEAATLRNQLAHTSRVTALGELAASLAHELNQPLSAVINNAEAATRLLSRPESDIDEALEALSDIASDGLRAGNVIRRLRALLRRDELEHKPLDINELILDVLDLVRSESVIENIHTNLELNPRLPLVVGDRTQLQQVLLNLILNAGEAMRQIDVGQRTLSIRSEVDKKSGVVVQVADSGPGMTSGNFEELFEPFFTTKSSGLGMGLSINRTIIESCGGRIWANNGTEGGAVFHFALPVHRE